MTKETLRLSIPPEAVAALQSGRKIEAIKIIREHLGVDLKTAKDLADNLVLAPDGKPAPEIIQKHATPVVLPMLLGLAATALLVQAAGFITEGSNASYCAKATRGKHLLCTLAPEWAETLLGPGQGYIGSAIVLGLLALVVAFMALVSFRGGQRKL